MIPNPLYLEDESHTLQAVGYEITLKRRHVADLVLPSGRLIACDPLTMPETEPFERGVPRGTFPVFAVVAELREETRIAYVMVEFSDHRPIRWDIAQLPGERPHSWRTMQRGGFHVESGIAGLMDVKTADVLLDVLHYAEDEDEFPRRLRRDLRRNRRPQTWTGYASIPIDEQRGGNLVAFDTVGGIYTTYFGSDSDGETAMVVLDFEVLEYEFTPFGLRY